MADHEWRVTRYDPALRSATGRFLEDSWTSVWDIGQNFSDATLTVDEYLRAESAYVRTATSFAVESGVFELRVVDLERDLERLDQVELTRLGLPPIDLTTPIRDDAVVPVGQWQHVMRAILRELAWCKLESDPFFVHFGHDFYMYVGSDSLCEQSQLSAKTSGLFVEEMHSPYA